MTSTPTSRRPLPVVGIDPGGRWTGVVLRHGDDVVTGTTLGPVNGDGEPDLTALDPDDVTGLRARMKYVRSVVATVRRLFEESEKRELGTPGVAVEAITPPRPKAPHARRSWLVPTAVMYGVVGTFHDARLISAAPARKSADYPRDLVGAPPAHWLDYGGVHVPKRRRDHERAAYDVAGALAWTEDGK